MLLQQKTQSLDKRTTLFISTWKMLLLSIVLSISVCSCSNNREQAISPEDFQKVEQESLGDQLFDALTSDDSPLDVLAEEDNTVLYEHIKTLYKQSYFILRAKQGWSKTRDWKIAIFQDEGQTAFAFPGGNLMISTGMLKTFRKEYELFYLFSFENSLMDSGILFANFLSFVDDSIDIEKLLDDADSERALLIGMQMIERLEFNTFVTQDVDRAAMQWICESSDFRVDGITQFLNILDDESLWLQSRMSSIDRLSAVVGNFFELDCDNNNRETSLGNDYYVDVILPLIPE